VTAPEYPPILEVNNGPANDIFADGFNFDAYLPIPLDSDLVVSDNLFDFSSSWFTNNSHSYAEPTDLSPLSDLFLPPTLNVAHQDMPKSPISEFWSAASTSTAANKIAKQQKLLALKAEAQQLEAELAASL